MSGDKLLDDIGIKILLALQSNARISFSELGRLVGLSSPAAAERVHRMESAGYIKGYQTTVDYEKIGLPIKAFISVTVTPSKLPELDEMVRTISEVVEAYHLSGNEDMLLKVVVSSMEHLENVINLIGNYGETTTSIMLSSPVASRTISPCRRDWQDEE